MSEHSVKKLVRNSVEDYAGDFSTDLLEQYKIYVQSVENVSARRVASSRYLLTLNAALVAFYGFQSVGFGQSYWALLIPIVGIPVSILWYLIIKSHADLNRVKFKVIHEFERLLPAAMYEYEWYLADEGRGSAYRAVTQIERWVPMLFVVLHVALADHDHTRNLRSHRFVVMNALPHQRPPRPRRHVLLPQLMPQARTVRDVVEAVADI